jgi:hypothetical protein
MNRMLKKIALASTLLLLPATHALAQGSSRGEAKATVAGKEVVIDYGRPSLKGRDMLGQAEIGKPWRMGANQPTTLKTAADLTFGKVAVPKGDYILNAKKVEADKWVLLVLASADQPAVAEIPLESATIQEAVEVFTVELTGAASKGGFQMKWGTTVLKAPFTGK